MTRATTLVEIFKEVEGFIDTSPGLFGEVDVVVGVSRGGLIPAVLIAARTHKPLVTAYIDKEDNVYFDRIEWLQGKRVLVVDDICRTGKTITKVADYLSENGIKNLRLYAVFSLQKELTYPLYAKFIEEDLRMPWDYE